ncbi:MAG: hypothetical protein ABEJ99_03510 [Candidatus Nanohaloarchaea archaeon]
MSNDSLDMHEIQKEILKRIGYHGSKSFSYIQWDDIESNKLSFHLKKLVEKGMIEKTKAGYRTTSKGREILPYFDLGDVRHPVNVVDLLIISNGKVYLQPKQDPLDPLSGDFRAPSSRTGKKDRLKNKAEEIFVEVFEQEPPKIKKAGVFDSMVHFLDGSQQHYILFFFKTEMDEAPGDYWFEIDDLDQLNILPGLNKVITELVQNDSIVMGEWDLEETETGFDVINLEF